MILAQWTTTATQALQAQADSYYHLLLSNRERNLHPKILLRRQTPVKVSLKVWTKEIFIGTSTGTLWMLNFNNQGENSVYWHCTLSLAQNRKNWE